MSIVTPAAAKLSAGIAERSTFEITSVSVVAPVARSTVTSWRVGVQFVMTRLLPTPVRPHSNV